MQFGIIKRSSGHILRVGHPQTSPIFAVSVLDSLSALSCLQPDILVLSIPILVAVFLDSVPRVFLLLCAFVLFAMCLPDVFAAILFAVLLADSLSLFVGRVSIKTLSYPARHSLAKHVVDRMGLESTRKTFCKQFRGREQQNNALQTGLGGRSPDRHAWHLWVFVFPKTMQEFRSLST